MEKGRLMKTRCDKRDDFNIPNVVHWMLHNIMTKWKRVNWKTLRKESTKKRDWTTKTHLKTGGELRWSEMISSSCSCSVARQHPMNHIGNIEIISFVTRNVFQFTLFHLVIILCVSLSSIYSLWLSFCYL
jgi:hypothetical protein